MQNLDQSAISELLEQDILTGEVTIEALKSAIENEQSVEISVIVAYEIVAGENVLHAVMPINIES